MNPDRNLNIPIADTIPLYLADKLELAEAVRIVTQSAPSNPSEKKDLLLSILSESKSLPRETDTYPTSPTPDLPSPAQERLLGLVRAIEDARRWRSGTGYGYGIALDAGEDEGQSIGSEEEEYELLKDVIRASFPSPFPGPDTTSSSSTSGGISSSERARQSSHGRYTEQRQQEDLSTSPFESTPSNSQPNPSSRRKSSLSSLSPPTSHHRRTSSTSGPNRHFANLVSFLAFLTKEHLLLSPGVGERIAVEMVRDTLSHHGGSISGSQHQHQQQQQYHQSQHQHQHHFQSAVGSSQPWFGDAGPASIAAAALWMIIMGEELYARVRAQERSSNGDGDGDGGGGGGNRRAGRVRGGIADEWETWTARLQYLSLREDLPIEVRESAAEGAAVMRRV
ncbi:hypothetical protein BJX64DRAFT_265107 [Aspergillus heterothallicus]